MAVKVRIFKQTNLEAMADTEEVDRYYIVGENDPELEPEAHGNQSDLQVLASASRNWAQDISNADPEFLDPAFWGHYDQFMQTMKDFESRRD